VSRCSGAGQPLSFDCAMCRRTTGPCRPYVTGVPLDHRRCSHHQYRTGRTRKAPPSSNRRSLDMEHEYVCECGHTGWHTGWSRHVDVMRLPLRDGGDDE